MDTHEKEFPRNFLRTINEFADWLNQHVDCAANKLVVHWSRHWDGDGEYLSVRVGAFDVWSGRDTPATVFCLDNLKATFLSHVEGLWNRPCVQQALAPVVVEFLEATIPDEKEVLRKLQDDTLQRYLPMTINQPRIVPPRFPISHGLYELYWNDEAGGGSSLAAVGSDEQGNRWYAPTNWISDVPCFDWTNIAQARLIESKVDKDETVPGESQVDYAAYMASVEKLYQQLGIPKRIFKGRGATVDEAADPSPAISRHWSSESLVLNHSKGTVEQALSEQDATMKAEELPEPAGYKHIEFARQFWPDVKLTEKQIQVIKDVQAGGVAIDSLMLDPRLAGVALDPSPAMREHFAKLSTKLVQDEKVETQTNVGHAIKETVEHVFLGKETDFVYDPIAPHLCRKKAEYDAIHDVSEESAGYKHKTLDEIIGECQKGEK